MSEINKELDNRSAIPSWSGFIYQGKVGLYHSLHLINSFPKEGTSLQHSVKFETLDDFVVYDSQNRAFSLHQVKATKSSKRSSYVTALKQASEVDHNSQCTPQTLRYFHVSQEIDNAENFPTGAEKAKNKVEFYQYSNNRKYVPVDEIDSLVESKIRLYLQSNELLDADDTVSLKRERLEALVSSRVNLAHRRNQGGKRKFDAADSTPITFEEIIKVLRLELMNINDEGSILFKYRAHLLKSLSTTITYFENDQQENEAFFEELARCHHFIAKMNDETLKKLYFSKSPHELKFDLCSFGNATTDRYMDIITELTQLRIEEKNKSLPHYYSAVRNERYLPSTIELGGHLEKKRLNELQKNIEGIRMNPLVRHVLYEYENLIIKDMKQQAFRLKDKVVPENKITDIEAEQDSEQSKITKMKNIRFVALEEVKGELGN